MNPVEAEVVGTVEAVDIAGTADKSAAVDTVSIAVVAVEDIAGQLADTAQ